MGSIPLHAIAPFAAAFVAQMVGVVLLPRTSGFTNIPATVSCIAVAVFSLWMVARIVHSGVNLGILFPLMVPSLKPVSWYLLS